MTKLHDTTETRSGEVPRRIPDLTDEISLALTHADELLKCALDGLELTTPCDIARAKLRQVENLLTIAEEKLSYVRRANLQIFRLTRQESAA